MPNLPTTWTPTQPHALPTSNVQDAETEDILNFIAQLDSVCVSNQTGWTHETATLALKASQSSHSSKSGFDFFSHFDTKLRRHLRDAYNRWQRCEDFSDSAAGAADFKSVETRASPGVRDIVGMIASAIITTAKKPRGKSGKAEAKAAMKRDNELIDNIDGMFEPTMGRSMSDSGSEP